MNLRQLNKDYDKSEDHLKAIQSVGQIIGEVLKQIDNEKFIVKSSGGPRYVVGVKVKLNRAKLVVGARVSLDMTTLTIMRILPREVDPMVFSMLSEDPGSVSYNDIGGLSDQLMTLREVKSAFLFHPHRNLSYGRPSNSHLKTLSSSKELVLNLQRVSLCMDLQVLARL